MYVKEIFFSYQGEAKYIGTPTLFIRFSGCNLNCFYCDTKKTKKILKNDNKGIDFITNKVDYLVKKYNPQFISLTGGEPLLQANLKDLLIRLRKYHKIKIYLETNSSLPKRLEKIIDLIDVVALNLKLPVDDIKKNDVLDSFNKTLKICKNRNKEFFVKIVITQNVYKISLIKKIVKIFKKNFVELVILQPEYRAFKNKKDKFFLNLQKLYSNLSKVVSHIHIIPQMHKILRLK